jgi:hypothetical protein
MHTKILFLQPNVIQPNDLKYSSTGSLKSHIFGPKQNEVKGEWRKLHSEKLHNFYSSPNIIRQIKLRTMRWVGHVAHKGEETEVYKILVGKPEGKRPLGRPRQRWEDGIRMDLGEIGWGVWSGFNWLRIGTSGRLL